ncbi:hypothetical protein CVT24_006506, partial [Panaeolus cyanescens]
QGPKPKAKVYGNKTSTTVLRKHLYSTHLDEWLESCNKLSIKITASDDALKSAIQDYNHRHSLPNNEDSHTGNQKSIPLYRPFSQEAFVDAIVEWIIVDDQSINAIENTQLRSIFLMLRKELRNSDIPHRTTIRERVIARWEKHLKDLENEMKACIKSVGWVTLDNASNNDTMMTSLEELLRSRDIEFRAEDQRIRCFPHIVNLAVQSILSAVTNLDYAKDDAQDFDPNPDSHTQRRDVIALLRTLINKIRASSLRRELFARTQEAVNPKQPILQLIRDVATRWSSTHLMIARALELRKVIDKFCFANSDVYQYRLTDLEWKTLEAYSKILAVPHAFQQKLSAEATPTLSSALPSFQRMIAVWKDYQTKMSPAYASVIAAGIDKLSAYYSKVIDVPAFQLAICKCINFVLNTNCLTVLLAVLNPKQKLRWFRTNLPDRVETAQQLLLDYVSIIIHRCWTCCFDI